MLKHLMTNCGKVAMDRLEFTTTQKCKKNGSNEVFFMT